MNAASHVARYGFAKEAVEDRRVCDVACGVGYGSFYLSKWASEVAGMDISEKAIKWAWHYFKNDNVSFYCVDGSKDWPVEEQFDVITSFETLEHIAEPRDFLRQVKGHLANDGVLYMSVPNGPRDKSKTDNPYHLHYFTEADLKVLIGEFFGEVSFYSQCYRKNWRHYGAKFLRKAGIVNRQRYFAGNYYLREGLNESVKTWFIIARP
jgi:2-polyprenyl-3-methyl-5-hydroxy-6-metoxy-1,4-benzoquinol methylase